MTIEPNGTWAVPGAKKDVTPSQEASYVDDDDLAVPEAVKSGGRTTTTPSLVSAPTSYLATPSSIASRDVSTAPKSSGKRPAREVIDLTWSDDEDAAARPVKRANHGTSGYQGAAC